MGSSVMVGLVEARTDFIFKRGVINPSKTINMAKSIIISYNARAENGYKAKFSNPNFKIPVVKDIAIVFTDVTFISSAGKLGFGFAIKLNDKFILVES